MSHALHGLYVITDSGLLPPDRLINAVEQAIAGGARIVQYRDKSDDHSLRKQQAEALFALCRSHGIPLLINDDVALAKAMGADGVHVGIEDASLAEAREQLGEQAIIGVSCYNRFDLAQEALRQGADYVAFGRFFSSNTKPSAVQANSDLLRQAREQLAIPVVAIGGITPENGGPLVEAGADMLAVIHGVFGQQNVRHAAQQYSALFEKR